MNIVEQLIRDEGLKLKPYHCPAGKLTIGVGHNLDGNGITNEIVETVFGRHYSKEEALLKFRNGITEAQAIELLHYDIKIHTAELLNAIPWLQELSEPRQGVLINMAFNMGVPRLLGFKKTLAFIKCRDYEMAVHGH